MAESTPKVSSGLEFPPSHEHAHGIHQRSAAGWRTIGILLAALAVFFAYDLHRQEAAVADLRRQLNTASAENAQLRADGEKANTVAMGLKLQVERMKKQQADLQAEVGATEGQVGRVQTQLDQSGADLRAAQKRDLTQTADWGGQLARANQRASDLQVELVQAKAQAAELNAQLAQARSQEVVLAAPASGVLPALPITMEFRKQLLSRKLALELKNVSSDPIELTITSSGPGKLPVRVVALNELKTAEIGGFAAGTHLEIAGTGFAPFTITVR
jgi:hypothetical protein